MNSKRYTLLSISLWWFFLFLTTFGYAAQIKKTDIKMLSPKEGTEIIAKKPVIRFRVSGRFKPDTLLVILDSTDITGLLRVRGKVISVKPFTVLAPGNHTLFISVTGKNGETVEKNFEFLTRHSKLFKEVVSKNELSMMYEGVLKKRNNPGTPYSRVEGNLNSMSKLSSENWRYSLKSNMRYLDQSIPVMSPLDKGIDLADYLFRADYKQNALSASVEVGNVTVDQSQNTLTGFAREGNRISLGWKGYKLNGFMLSTSETFGFNEDLYQDKDLDYRIMGITGEACFFSEKLNIKTFYIAGDEPCESFGSWEAGGDKKGNVLGVLATSYLFDRKVEMNAEFDMSDYDLDQSDEFSSENDKAYRFNVRNMFGKYTLAFLYSYMGPDYSVIGNAYMPNNREEISMNAGANFTEHAINFCASKSNDNVDKDKLFARYTSSQYTMDYSFNKFQTMPLRISYNKAMMKSSLEPEFTMPSEIETDTWSAQTGYMKGRWNLSLQTSYSLQNDRVTTENDTKSFTVTLSPSYSRPRISLTPCFTFMQTDYRLTDVSTDTYSANLDIRGEMIKKKMACEFSGGLSKTKADDESSDMYSINTNTRLSYVICKSYWRMLNPTAVLIGRYTKTRDNIYDTKFSESAVLVVLTNTLAFSL